MGSARLNAIIRTDASVQIGMGHRVRCEVLSDALKLRGVDVTFAVHQYCSEFRRPMDFVFVNETEWHKRAVQADIVVLDHYGYDALQISKLFALNPNLLIIDDNNNRGDLSCRWVLNPLPLSYSKAVQIPLTGPDFALLRPHFIQARERQVEIRDKLLVTFGGTDPLELTLPFLKSLIKRQFPVQLIVVMVGSGTEKTQEIEEFCRQTNIGCHVAVNDVSKLMMRSRYAISAAGGTLFELACMGVPAHFIQVADNQRDSLEEHVALGWCVSTNFVNCSPDGKSALIDEVVGGVLQAWQTDLSTASNLARSCIDGLGVQRIVDVVLSTRLKR